MAVLGIGDPLIWSAYLLCIVSSIACVVYGMINWNKGDTKIYPEDIKWAKDEEKVEEEL